MISYADRTNMSLAILPMLRELGRVDARGAVDASAEGVLLAAFFAGYICTQVPGGYAAQRFGARRVLAAGSLVWSFSTLFIPLAAAGGFWLLVVLRIALGVGEGVCASARRAAFSVCAL